MSAAEIVQHIVNEVAARFRANDMMLKDIVQKVINRFESNEKHLDHLTQLCNAQHSVILELKKQLDDLSAEYYLLGPGKDK